MDYKHIPVPTDLENVRNTLELLLQELTYQSDKIGSIPTWRVTDRFAQNEQDLTEEMAQEVLERNMARYNIQDEILRRFQELESKARGIAFALDGFANTMTELGQRQH